MWISRKTDYATRAVLALAIADGESLKSHEIAARTHIPSSFLEQIMAQLRGAGLVRSVRGPAGGYRLNHPPADITLEEWSVYFRDLSGPDCMRDSFRARVLSDGPRVLAEEHLG